MSGIEIEQRGDIVDIVDIVDILGILDIQNIHCSLTSILTDKLTSLADIYIDRQARFAC